MKLFTGDSLPVTLKKVISLLLRRPSQVLENLSQSLVDLMESEIIIRQPRGAIFL